MHYICNSCGSFLNSPICVRKYFRKPLQVTFISRKSPCFLKHNPQTITASFEEPCVSTSKRSKSWLTENSLHYLWSLVLHLYTSLGLPTQQFNLHNRVRSTFFEAIYTFHFHFLTNISFLFEPPKVSSCNKYLQNVTILNLVLVRLHLKYHSKADRWISLLTALYCLGISARWEVTIHEQQAIAFFSLHIYHCTRVNIMALC